MPAPSNLFFEVSLFLIEFLLLPLDLEFLETTISPLTAEIKFSSVDFIKALLFDKSFKFFFDKLDFSPFNI